MHMLIFSRSSFSVTGTHLEECHLHWNKADITQACIQLEPSKAPPSPDTYRCLLGKGGKHGIGSLSDSLHDGQEILNPRPFSLKFNASPT